MLYALEEMARSFISSFNYIKMFKEEGESISNLKRKENINLNVPNKNVDLFIKLKEAVENCVSQKVEIEDKAGEIQELNIIIIIF